MNDDEFLVFLEMKKRQYSQRQLSNLTGFSLGKINRIVNLIKKKDDADVTVNKAIILCAGYGLRMAPANVVPKALIQVKGEILVERLIKQLHERAINEIYIVVGFMKEKFEYLIDKYNVKLLCNNEYYNDNNSKSLYMASKYLENAYIIPGDLYFNDNPFSKYENYSWYMLSNYIKDNGYYDVDDKGFLQKGINKFHNVIGVAYISKKDSTNLMKNLETIKKIDRSFWDEALFINEFKIRTKIVDKSSVFEINTYENLREIDENSQNLINEHIEIIKQCFKCDLKDIKKIETLKKGMTNRSFCFEYEKEKYIVRIPGEGTECLINRQEEYEVYTKVNALKICDELVYFNPENGVKITKYIKHTRNCDFNKWNDVSLCMKYLKKFHEKKIKVNHEFNLFEQLDYYEKLFGCVSLYADYKDVKINVLRLKSFIENFQVTKYLTHIDAVPDNFLIDTNNRVYLIDWEYAGNQDVHVDIAMFAIYSGYDKNEIDKLINIYFENSCADDIRYKIYAYISICGLLWSNWCEYKHKLGVEFGEYSLLQYRYAKEYSKMVLDYLEGKNV